ncbi:hypothetical protein [Planococcus halocryophilus]|uniref:YxiG family protein n=1 Tax=Planococcus halocryophilus TaxID=1215089 RepID=UPI00059276DA|nr:hypothetical protein [Planococcus halocryophilus]
MKETHVQKLLNALWGTVISNLEMNLLTNTLSLEIEQHNKKGIEHHKLIFIDVSAYYYVKDEINRRFNFYDQEETGYLQLSTVTYYGKGLNEICVTLPQEEEWVKQYPTKFNIVLEIWESVVFIEARKVQFNSQILDLK